MLEVVIDGAKAEAAVTASVIADGLVVEGIVVVVLEVVAFD